jgi:hypothetical protein
MGYLNRRSLKKAIKEFLHGFLRGLLCQPM